MRIRDYRRETSQFHIGCCRLEIFLYDILRAHQGKDRLVFVVGEQLALLGQTHGVDAMRLEHADGKERECRCNHQRQEEVVTTRELCNEEDTRERGVHDTTHQSGHAKEGKVVLGQIDLDTQRIEEVREYKSRDTSQEKAGGEDTTTSATGIRCRGGKHLEEHNKSEVHKQHTRVSIEE